MVVVLQSSIAELDALVADLSAVRERLERVGPDGLVLWEAETTLRHVGERATRRADVLRAAIHALRD
jgi:sugar phosphate isomerase/epimerase